MVVTCVSCLSQVNVGLEDEMRGKVRMRDVRGSATNLKSRCSDVASSRHRLEQKYIRLKTLVLSTLFYLTKNLDRLGLDELCITTTSVINCHSNRREGGFSRSTSATAHTRTSLWVFSSETLFNTLSTTVLTSRACSFSFSCCSKRAQLSSTALTSAASATLWRRTNASASSCAVSCDREAARYD